MRTLSLVRGFLVVIVFAGLTTTCNDPQSRLPTGPSEPTVTGVTINGPASIAPGQSGQFIPVLRFPDGTTKTPVPSNVTWSSNTGLLSVTASGLATAKQNTSGEAVLTATVRPTPNSVRTASMEVIIVPDGTYRLVGVVNDAEFPTAPVVGARVQVTPGSLNVTTDSTGRYKLYGVPPDAEIRITADGYQPLVQNIQLTTHTTRNFQLMPPGPRLTIAGNYRLAIDVVGACSGSPILSADLQHRRYDAVLTQNGPTLDVTLTEPIFRINSTGRGNKFSGQVGTTGVIFTLVASYSYYYYAYAYPNLVERLSNGTFLVVSGVAATTGSAAGLSGQMSGAIENYDSRFPNAFFSLGYCFSPLQFSLTPR